LEGTLKLNIDGSFLKDFGCLGADGVVRNHDRNWIAGFFTMKLEVMRY